MSRKDKNKDPQASVPDRPQRPVAPSLFDLLYEEFGRSPGGTLMAGVFSIDRRAVADLPDADAAVARLAAMDLGAYGITAVRIVSSEEMRIIAGFGPDARVIRIEDRSSGDWSKKP